MQAHCSPDWEHDWEHWEQLQFPPQRRTSKQPGQKMASVLLSSSRSDTDTFRGEQLYRRTSSLSWFRSAPTGDTKGPPPLIRYSGTSTPHQLQHTTDP